MAFDTNERRILGYSSFAHFAVHFFEQMFPTAAVGIALESGVPIAIVLGWSFLGYLAFGVGALPAGWVTDRWSARGMLELCVGASGVAALVVAVAPAGTGMPLALGLLGLATSIYHPAGMGIIAGGVRERGRALGINGIFGNAGIALAPVVTAGIMAVGGWRSAYVVAGVGVLVAWAVGRRFRMPEPEPPGTDARREEPPYGSSAFPILCVCMMLAGIIYRGTTLVGPAVLAQEFSAVHFGTALSAAYLVGTFGQYFGGTLADRYDLRIVYLGFHLVSLPALWLLGTSTGTTVVVAMSVYVFFALGMQPAENSLVAHLAPIGRRSTSYGIKFILTFGVGALAAPLVERLDAARGPGAVFPVLSLALVLLLVVGAVFAATTRGVPLRNDPAAS